MICSTYGYLGAVRCMFNNHIHRLPWQRGRKPFLDMVDLGLPSGLLWSSSNLWATCGDDLDSWYGTYYSWGEIVSKQVFTSENYRFNDNPDVLASANDVVFHATKGECRMPTREECEELISNTEQTYISDYQGIEGLNGVLFTGVNGNSIFLPKGGYCNTEKIYDGTYGYFWTSSIDDQAEVTDNLAYAMCAGEGESNTGSAGRYFGMCLRGVK